MNGNNEEFKWLKTLLCSLILSLLTVGVFSEEATAQASTYIFVPEAPPPQCPPNELYYPCLSGCSNCEDRGWCYSNCTESGCDCIPHFVRLVPGGPCEPLSKCPIPECLENEVFRECGPVCEWCGTLPCRELECDHKCYCKEGYRRDFGGKCVPEKECPQLPECFANEEVASSGLADEYCLHSETEVLTNETVEEERCYCLGGFKRNVHGFCVEEIWCPYIVCYGIETYQPCPKKCNTTCRNYGDPDCVEDGNCYPGCFCPEGYVMSDYRRCVTLEECPPGSNPYAPPFVPPIALPEVENSSNSTAATEIPEATSATTATRNMTPSSNNDVTTKADEDETTYGTVAVTAAAETSERTEAFEETTPSPETTPPPKVKTTKKAKELKVKEGLSAKSAQRKRDKAAAAAAASETPETADVASSE